MFRIILAALVVIHGLIHFWGFAAAFGYTNRNTFDRVISKSAGILWLGTALIFLVVAALIMLKKGWWHLGMLAVVLSQILIVMVWSQAKWGSIINIVLLAPIVVNFAYWQFQNKSQQNAEKLLSAYEQSSHIVTLTDIRHLPPLVQNGLQIRVLLGNTPQTQYG